MNVSELLLIRDEVVNNHLVEMYLLFLIKKKLYLCTKYEQNPLLFHTFDFPDIGLSESLTTTISPVNPVSIVLHYRMQKAG